MLQQASWMVVSSSWTFFLNILRSLFTAKQFMLLLCM